MYVFYVRFIVIIAILFVGLVFNIYTEKKAVACQTWSCDRHYVSYMQLIFFFIIHSPSVIKN